MHYYDFETLGNRKGNFYIYGFKWIILKNLIGAEQEQNRSRIGEEKSEIGEEKCEIGKEKSGVGEEKSGIEKKKKLK